MTSIPERRAIREDALQSLSRAGIDNVHVVEQKDPSRGGDAHFRTIHTALSYGDRNRPLLYLEDDILVAPWFGDAVQSVTQSHPVVTFYLSRSRSFYPRHILRIVDSGQDIPPELYPVRNSRHWYGSQALLLSPVAQDTILSSWQPEYLDNQIRVLFDDIFVYLPNPVQHMAAKRTWGGGKPHTSLTYREEL
jgi:hypothetical protein